MVKRASRLVLGVTMLAGVLAFTSAPTEAMPLKCQGKVVTIKGNNKANRIVGTNGPDVIHALGGNDIVFGKGGNDTICLGGGNDKGYGGNGRDRISGGNGGDLINGGNGIDPKLNGDDGHDLIDGAKGGGNANGGQGRDACYNATQGKGSQCEKDQLWASWWSPQRSDIVEVDTHNPGSYFTYGINVPVNAKKFRRGLGCTEVDFPNQFCEYSYNLSRKYRRFAAYVGLDDRSENVDVTNSFEVIGDGNVIATQVAGFGERKRIVANVTGVLRLTIRIGYVSGESSGDEWAYFTDPRVSRHPGLYPAAPVG